MPIIYSGNSGGPVVETRKEKLYTAIATGNASLLENLLSDPVYRLILSEMTFSPSEVAINTIISSQTALNTVVNSITAMTAIVNSITAMTAIANSSTAMTAVANSSTAMTAIINNQTALNAIDSVPSARSTFVRGTGLPQKSVPTMTSNTAPEGQAIGSSFLNSNYNYFRAFDKNTSTYWHSVSGPPQWIGYVFSVPVFVHQVRILGYGGSGTNENPTSITIQCSSDGSTWQNVATYNQEFTSTETVLDIPLRAGFYRYWRVYIASVVNGSYAACKELNFIGFAQQ